LAADPRHTGDDRRGAALRDELARPGDALPISVVGTGPDLNSATDNGLARAAELLDMSIPEVKNRATIAGAIEIGRHPGVVQVTFRAPAEALEARPPGLRGRAVRRALTR